MGLYQLNGIENLYYYYYEHVSVVVKQKMRTEPNDELAATVIITATVIIYNPRVL